MESMAYMDVESLDPMGSTAPEEPMDSMDSMESMGSLQSTHVDI